jgi:aminocarboxymuconate-semialdehyde decarboxylase
MKIFDAHNHWYPPPLVEAYLDRTEYPRWRKDGGAYSVELAPERWYALPPQFFELDRQVAEMQSAGVDAVISSSASFGDVDGLPLPRAREVAIAVNEARASAERQYEGYFYGLATIPWQDTDAALEVLQDAVERLGLRGVLIHTNIAGRPIDSDHCFPVYEQLAEQGIPLFIHPTRTVMEEHLRQYGLEYVLGYMFDSSIAAVRLVFGEIVQRLPQLKVVHPHAGAAVPYLAGRIDSSYSQGYSLDRTFPRAPSQYLANFHTDTMCQSRATLQLAKEFYGVRHVLFGSDYPYFGPQEALDFVRSALSEEEAIDVLSVNAAKLLGLEGLLNR